MTVVHPFPTFDQVALRCEDAQKKIRTYRKFGVETWVHDRVDAVHLYSHPTFALGESFSVRLAFNYDILPNTELELIESINGRTVQLLVPQLDMSNKVVWTEYAGAPVEGLSHLGYHVEDQRVDESGHGREDLCSLNAALREWQDRGCLIAQVSQTVVHQNTRKRYRYAFVDARFLMGAWVKIIQRMTEPSNDRSVSTGRELFSFLQEQPA